MGSQLPELKAVVAAIGISPDHVVCREVHQFQLELHCLVHLALGRFPLRSLKAKLRGVHAFRELGKSQQLERCSSHGAAPLAN